MVTTIQVSHELKKKLTDLKKSKTYEEVIKRLLLEHEKKIIAEEMEDYGKKHAKQSLNELKEWESSDLDW